MKNKPQRVLFTVLAGLIIASSLLFTACDTENNNNSSVTTSANSGEATTIPSGGESSSLTDTKMTEEEWKTALSKNSFSNVSIDFAGTVENVGLDTQNIAYYKISIAGNKQYYHETEIIGGVEYKTEQYCEQTDNGFYRYYMSNDKWTKGEIETGISIDAWVDIHILADHFSSFEFSDGSYIAKSCDIEILTFGQPMKLTDAEFKFDKSKLTFAKCRIEFIEEGKTEPTQIADFEFTFSNYGTTAVTLPTVE